jgi:hypothetical protein
VPNKVLHSRCGNKNNEDEGTLAPTDGKSMGELQIKGAWVINSYFKTKTRIALQMTDGLKPVM